MKEYNFAKQYLKSQKKRKNQILKYLEEKKAKEKRRNEYLNRLLKEKGKELKGF